MHQLLMCNDDSRNANKRVGLRPIHDPRRHSRKSFRTDFQKLRENVCGMAVWVVDDGPMTECARTGEDSRKHGSHQKKDGNLAGIDVVVSKFANAFFAFLRPFNAASSVMYRTEEAKLGRFTSARVDIVPYPVLSRREEACRT